MNRLRACGAYILLVGLAGLIVLVLYAVAVTPAYGLLVWCLEEILRLPLSLALLLTGLMYVLYGTSFLVFGRVISLIGERTKLIIVTAVAVGLLGCYLIEESIGMLMYVACPSAYSAAVVATGALMAYLALLANAVLLIALAKHIRRSLYAVSGVMMLLAFLSNVLFVLWLSTAIGRMLGIVVVTPPAEEAPGPFNLAPLFRLIALVIISLFCAVSAFFMALALILIGVATIRRG